MLRILLEYFSQYFMYFIESNYFNKIIKNIDIK